MDNICIFPASTSNQMTEEYYNFLVGQINRGVSKHKVCRVLHQNGSHKYFTYHLVSVR